MCEATVYLDDEIVLHDVTTITVVEDGVRLTSLFEPSRVLAAAIREIDCAQHRVMLVPLTRRE